MSELPGFADESTGKEACQRKHMSVSYFPKAHIFTSNAYIFKCPKTDRFSSVGIIVCTGQDGITYAPRSPEPLLFISTHPLSSSSRVFNSLFVLVY